MTRPIPPHGSEARYQGALDRPGCRCRSCIDGWTRAGKKRKLAGLEGRPATVPAQPVTDHLVLLRASGMTAEQIATAANVSLTSVTQHAAGRFTIIRRTTAEKILAVRGGQATWRVPALGTRRRLQALSAIGYGPYSLAEPTGLTANGIAKVCYGAVDSVSVHTRDAVERAYRELADTAGPSLRARQRAEDSGWVPPAYWDDDTIDDPDFVPAAVDSENKRVIAAVRAADIRHLGSFNLPEHEIAARVDVTPQYVRAQLRWTYLADEARRLFKLRYTHDEAAARLNVTPSLLSKALQRSPAQHAAQDTQLEAA